VSDTRSADVPALAPRLRSLDALRGFDMFWIIGGHAIFAALAQATQWRPLLWIDEQCRHVEWHGFALWDLVFPLFLFIAGVAMPFSFAQRLARGDTRSTLAWHVVRRGLVLIFLGVVYNGLLRFDFANLRYASVLGRIGSAYALAGLVVLAAPMRVQVALLGFVLLLYWALLALVPVPGFGAGNFEPGATLTDHIDRLFLPGRLHRGDRDPEGLLGILPAVATALSGALAGRYLRAAPRPGVREARTLFVAGVGSLLLGVLWGQLFPINKNLWSSSFVLVTSGLSLALLSGFYLVIDVWKLERWSFFFVVIGSNAIAIYMAQAFVDFGALVELVFGEEPSALHPAWQPILTLGLEWVLLWGLYRRRLFLRV
jgi:predicted acyltransferase